MEQPSTEHKTDTSFDASVRRLFTLIGKNGADVFCSGGALEKYRESNLLRNMIAHFEEAEEYEKCAFLTQVAGEVLLMSRNNCE